MKITDEFLHKHEACSSSLKYVKANNYIGLEAGIFIKKLIEEKRLSDANWLITRCLSKKNKVKYAVFAAEQVLHIYEKQYPNDNRPRKAIEPAKKFIASSYDAYAAAAADAAADAASAAAAAASAAGLKMHIIHYGTRLIKEETNHERKL